MISLQGRVAGHILRHPWRVLAAAAGIALIAAGGLTRAQFSDDIRVWFSTKNPQLRAFEALENTYTRYDNPFFVLAPASGDGFDPRSLTAVFEVEVTLPEGARGELERVAAAANELARWVRGRYPDIRVYLTGSIMIDQTFLQATRDDLALLLPAMFAVVALVTALLLRSIA